MTRPRLARYRTRLTLQLELEVGAASLEQAAERLEEIADVLVAKLPAGVVYRSGLPKQMAGRPISLVVERTATPVEACD